MNFFRKITNLRAFAFLSLSATFILGTTTLVAADGFTIDEIESGVTVKYNGELVTNYIIDEANKPYMYPLVGPTGKLMTRAYPMKTVEGEHHDHPHHRSIWFGHQRVGGFDTWHEPLSAAAKNLSGDNLQAFKEKLGTTVHRDFKRLLASEKRAVIETRNDYIGGTGKELMSDERVVTFRMMRGQLVIDFDITFIASYGDVEIGDMKDAGLSVRIPSSMSLKSEMGGKIVNSEGVRDGDTRSKRAAWVDYHGPVGGEHLGIAILNHPDSFRYPTPWHVRTYGLFTANPFGFKSLDKTLDDASFTLIDGTRFLLRHRLIFHEGDEKDAKIAQAFKAYSKQ